MNPVQLRKAIDDAINKLYSLSGQCNSEPVKEKLASARLQLRLQLEEIDRSVLRALEEEAA
jgi:hypothetical protein